MTRRTYARAHIVDTRLLKANISAQAADEQIALRAIQQPADDFAVHQREVARVMRNGHVAEGGEDPVKGLVHQAPEDGHVALDPPAEDDVPPCSHFS